MKYFDFSKQVILALFKSFFSNCALNFETKFFVISMFMYLFLADRKYALLRYDTQALVFFFNRGDTVSRRSPIKGVRPSPYTTLWS